MRSSCSPDVDKEQEKKENHQLRLPHLFTSAVWSRNRWRETPPLGPTDDRSCVLLLLKSKQRLISANLHFCFYLDHARRWTGVKVSTARPKQAPPKTSIYPAHLLATPLATPPDHAHRHTAKTILLEPGQLNPEPLFCQLTPAGP